MLWVAAVAPPMVVMTLRARWPRRRSAAPKAGRPHDPDSLPELERRFTTALNRLVPEPAACDGPQLVAALRAAGIEGPRAAHIARLRDRLRQAEYGGSAAPDATELVAEVREVLAGPLAERIAGARPGWPAIALVAFTLPAAAGAQDVSAERLLEAGAFAAAADSFAARAAKVPRDPVAWYHLGVAWFSVGSTERARAAWIRAARLAPRHGDIRRALSRTGPGDPRSRRLEWVAPVTPDEALLVALGCWFLGWVLVAGRWKRNLARGLLALGMAAAAYTGLVTARYRTPAALVLVAGTPLREAPYGSAPAVDRLTAGAVVRVEATRPGWILATFGGRRGWLIRSEIVRL
jgi:hypothetical protein